MLTAGRQHFISSHLLLRTPEDKQNALTSPIGSDHLTRQTQSCTNRFVVFLFVAAISEPSSQHRHCVSVGIKMQSYYTLEGLSQSRRMAMNFKCRIRAYREAGTWERLSQLSANLIFFILVYFLLQKSLATRC